MEVNNDFNNSYVNPLVNSNDVSSLSGSINLKALDTAVGVSDVSDESYSLNIDSSYKRSDLASLLKDAILNISKNQQALNNLSEQSNVLNKLQEVASTLIKSETPKIITSEAQLTMEEFINKFNNLTQDFNKRFAESQDDTTSRTYFDGLIGAKPLSPSEIIDAVERQMKIINQNSETATKEIQEFKSKAIETIEKEIAESNAKAPFEPIDFGKNISDFTSANINNIVGSVATVQANAIPAHSPRLLS